MQRPSLGAGRFLVHLLWNAVICRQMPMIVSLNRLQNCVISMRLIFNGAYRAFCRVNPALVVGENILTFTVRVGGQDSSMWQSIVELVVDTQFTIGALDFALKRPEIGSFRFAITTKKNAVQCLTNSVTLD